jgi:hypothetical protein
LESQLVLEVEHYHIKSSVSSPLYCPFDFMNIKAQV